MPIRSSLNLDADHPLLQHDADQGKPGHPLARMHGFVLQRHPAPASITSLHQRMDVQKATIRHQQPQPGPHHLNVKKNPSP